MNPKYHFDLETSTCIFCAACASVAPGHFFVDPDAEIAQVTRQPETGAEAESCRAAMISCPTSSIRESGDHRGGRQRGATLTHDHRRPKVSTRARRRSAAATAPATHAVRGFRGRVRAYTAAVAAGGQPNISANDHETFKGHFPPVRHLARNPYGRRIESGLQLARDHRVGPEAMGRHGARSRRGARSPPAHRSRIRVEVTASRVR